MRRFGLTIAVVVGMLAMAASASASLVLTIDDLSTAGLDVVVIDDADGGVASLTATVADGYAGDGASSYMGSVGTFTFSFSGGISHPVTGPGAGYIDLNSLLVSGGAGTLVFQLTDTDFDHTLVPSPASMVAGIAGGTQGIVSFTAALDTENNEFGGGSDPDYVISTGPLGPDGFGNFDGGGWLPLPTLTEDYSWTETITVTHTGPGQSTSFNALSEVVPEPASIAIWSLIGLSCAGLGVLRRRRPGTELAGSESRSPWTEENRTAIMQMIDRGRHNG